VICSLSSHLRRRKGNAYLFGPFTYSLPVALFLCHAPRALLRSGCKLVRMVSKSAYYFRHVRPSICPHTSARLPLDGFPWNFIFWTLVKIVNKIQICLKWGINIGHFTWRDKKLLLFAVKFNHHKTLCMSEKVPGC